MKSLESIMQDPKYPRIKLVIECDNNGEFSGKLLAGFEVLIAIRGYTELDKFLARFVFEAERFLNG